MVTYNLKNNKIRLGLSTTRPTSYPALMMTRGGLNMAMHMLDFSPLNSKEENRATKGTIVSGFD